MIEQAAQWAAQLATDEATQEDRDACAAWCREDPRHGLAMDRMRGLDSRIGETDAAGREAIGAVLENRARGRRRLGAATLGAVLVLGGAWLAGQSLALRAWFPDHRTAHGEQRVVALEDGSGLTLDSDAAVDVDDGRARQAVTLFRGRILARVVRNPARVFVVATKDGTATALGTVFSVRRDGQATTITTLESHVRACPTGVAEADCVTLVPGDRVRMAGGRLTRLARVDPVSAGTWAEGWLAVDDQLVADVLDELNRYLREPVRFDRADLGGVRVSGSFPLREPDRALEAIVASTRLRTARAPDGARVVRRTE